MITFAVILALLGVLAWGLKKAQAGPREKGMAPDFTITGFDGTAVTLSELRGVHIGPLQSPQLDEKRHAQNTSVKADHCS